ncbi:MAG: amidohydrolase [Candidatus Bathyarchaeota archaeon]|nr:amidohydrolase [Candidatus Bathyarchaeota archaeon]
MNLKIADATVVTMDHKRTLHHATLIIEDGRITDLGKHARLKHKYPRYEKLDAAGKVIIPGLVNTHQHMAMSLLRGYADDIPLQEWLDKWIWPLEKHLAGHDIHVGALLAAVEAVMSGTTTINTMYHFKEEGNEAQALAEVGLRGIVGHVCFSWRKDADKKALRNLARDWHNQANGLIRTSVDPHAPYTVDPEYLTELREITRELNVKHGSSHAPIMWHTHLAETSDEPNKINRAFKVSIHGGIVEYLDSLGILDSDIVAAHCVALSPRDILILKQRDVKVSHNPISNLKLGSGISPVPEMLKSGVAVSLGTDSACSNNSADMFQVMKTTALLHKGVQKEPTLLPAEQVLEMATFAGAKALLWEKEIGSIEVGKDADLIMIDFHKPHLRPLYNETRHLVYSAKAADVDTVLVKGRIVMENRKVVTVDVEKILDLAETTKQRLLARLE